MSKIVLILYWRPKDYTISHLLVKAIWGFTRVVQNPKSQGEREREREREREQGGEISISCI
jgi:hypothetical protein